MILVWLSMKMDLDSLLQSSAVLSWGLNERLSSRSIPNSLNDGNFLSECWMDSFKWYYELRQDFR
jgi:hypothetical protein